MTDKMSEEEATSPSATDGKVTPEEAPVSDDDGVGSKDGGVEAAIDRQSGGLDDTQRETFARDQTGILGTNKRGSSTGSGEGKSRGSSLSSALKRLSFGGGGGGGSSSQSDYPSPVDEVRLITTLLLPRKFTLKTLRYVNMKFNHRILPQP